MGSFVFSFGLKFLFPGLPWMDRMGLVFLMCCALIVLLGKKDQPANAYTRHDPALFHTGRDVQCNVGSHTGDINRLLLLLVVNLYTCNNRHINETDKDNLFAFGCSFLLSGTKAFAQVERLP